MTLEDHLGDIIAKGRGASGVSAPVAAQAAGLNEAEFTALEETGHSSRPVNFQALADLLGLNPVKLERIAKGWLPATPDLPLWRELRQITTSAEGLTVHCYLVWDEGSHEAALFDTGWDAAPIFKLIEENDLTPRHLFLTHMHQDHVAAMGGIRAKFPKLHLHTNSKIWAACASPTATRPDTPTKVSRILLAAGRRTPRTSRSWATRFLPARLAVESNPGTWPAKKSASRFSPSHRRR